MNIGLAGMVFISLLPAGYLQLKDALEHGYWHARLLSFYHSSPVVEILWARIVPDLVFTAGVIVLIIIVVKVLRNLKPADNEKAAAHFDALTAQEVKDDQLNVD